jgi:DNA-binding CsgD family transcriptional regulator
VDLILAASSDPVRRELEDLTEGANLPVRSVARDPTALAKLLRRGDAWVVTGGTLTLMRPFLSTARTANAAVVAALIGGAHAGDRSDLGYGGLAVLRAMPRTDTFQAAVIASRVGLSVWDPEINSQAKSAESVEAPLSPRERTVLQRTGAGLSTKAIARELGISPNTVKFHLQAAFDKLGVTSRAEAVMAAIRRGELSV